MTIWEFCQTSKKLSIKTILLAIPLKLCFTKKLHKFYLFLILKYKYYKRAGENCYYLISNKSKL